MCVSDKPISSALSCIINRHTHTHSQATVHTNVKNSDFKKSGNPSNVHHLQIMFKQLDINQ